MSSIFAFILNSLSQNSERIFFQIILLILISASLFTIFSNRKSISHSTYHRAISTVLFILGMESLFLIGLFLISQGILQLEIFLKLFFQFIFSISALWVIWLWCFPLASMKSDGPKYIFGTTLTLIFLFQLFFIYVVKVINIEISIIANIIWFLTTLIILVFGLILLIINHRPNWFIGCIFTSIFFAGLLAAQLLPGIDDLKSISILFLTRIIAFSILPVLSISLFFTEFSEEEQVSNNLSIAGKNMTILPSQEVFQSWLRLAIKNQDILIANEFLKCIALTFHADLVLLLSTSNKSDNLSIISGFSKNKSKLIFPLLIKNGLISIFEGNMKGDKPFYFSTQDYFPNNLLNFLKIIKVTQPVNLLFYPIKFSNQSNTTAGILLFSSLLRWDKNHLEYFKYMKDEMQQILQKIFPENETQEQQSINYDSQNGTEKKTILTKSLHNESNEEKIHTLESELKLALEEYARVQKLLEENIHRSNFSSK
jgi:hypothetical protein